MIRQFTNPALCTDMIRRFANPALCLRILSAVATGVFIGLAGLVPSFVLPAQSGALGLQSAPSTDDRTEKARADGPSQTGRDTADATRGDYTVLSKIQIKADGPGGVDTYEIFRSHLGKSCIEAPDVYPNNHLGQPHIVENTGSRFGSHFTFLIHRDHDEDKNDDGSKGRQRNEVRGDNNSPRLVKATEGETIRYHWFFRIGSDYRGDENHTIFFQLHNVDAGPIVKIQSYKSDLAFRYDADNRNRNESVLDSYPFNPLRGQWLEAEVVATFSNRGYLRMTVRDEAGAVVMHTEKQNIDMWTSSFTRPKWGIYRALDRSITNSEDTTDFADITIEEVVDATPVETPSIKSGMNLEAYPNPFRDVATVAVTLDRSAPVRVDLHDALGRRVATLVDTFLPIGRSEVHVNGGRLATGVYSLSMRDDAGRMFHTFFHRTK